MIGKRIRFEVFKRDRFTCQYCGRRPPQVLLEIDHILPVCEGGDDEAANLTTSCSECNLGKGGIPLGEVRPALDEMEAMAAIQEMAERRALLRGQLEEARAQREVEDAAIADIRELWLGIGGAEDAFGEASVRRFLSYLTVEELFEAMNVTGAFWERHSYAYQGNAWRYFCGVCWRSIRAQHEDVEESEEPAS